MATRDPQPTLDTVRAGLDQQLSFIDEIDSKTGLFVSAGGAVLAVVPAVMALRGDHQLNGVAIVALVLSALSYAVVALFGYRVLKPTVWSDGPDADELAARYHDHGMGDLELATWIIATTYEAHRDNDGPLAVKVARYRVCFGALILETGVVFLALVALVLIH